MSEKSADKEPQNCWIGKNQKSECEERKIRVKGVAGQHIKCQKCLELFPVAESGIKAGIANKKTNSKKKRACTTW